jgi:peptide/nickel transport system permease protein
MTAWLLRRLGAGIAIIAAVATLTFIAVHLAPGTPFQGDDRPMDPAVVARLRSRFGLDRPLPVQYVDYLAGLVHGDLGESFSQRRPVGRVIADAMPNTLLLAGTALAIDFLLGMTIGMVQAAHVRRRLDVALTNTTLFLYSLPTFWLGLVLLLAFGRSGWFPLFPVGGVTDPAIYDALPLAGKILNRLYHLVLPALTLGLVGAAGTARYQRAALLEALNEDYVRTARAKGLSETRILVRHVLRNALIPIVTLLGIALPFLLTGAVVVETVFAWPGLGKVAADAINARDYPLVLGTTLLASVLVVLGSLIADLLTTAVDPRVRRAA